jgi:hypothetical protein
MGRAQVTGARYLEVALHSRDGLLTRLIGNDPGSLDLLLDGAGAGGVSPSPVAQPVLLACDFDLPHGWTAPR